LFSFFLLSFPAATDCIQQNSIYASLSDKQEDETKQNKNRTALPPFGQESILVCLRRKLLCGETSDITFIFQLINCPYHAFSVGKP
jgi:hypothetical protein